MKAAIIGGGVIGGGWAARFLLNGWDVAVCDPDPEAERKIGEVLANARRAPAGALRTALAGRGPALSLHTDNRRRLSRGADWIQESVPERLRDQACHLRRDRGHRPAGCGDRFFHLGFQTVGAEPDRRPRDRGASVQPGLPAPAGGAGGRRGRDGARPPTSLRGIGMFPLTVRKEIDAHIADRFLEAVWREALLAW